MRPLAGRTIFLFAVACGLAVANLYYAQPLLDTIGRGFHVGEATSGLIVTVTQFGYAIGLLLLAPLGDLIENRRLIATIFMATICALLAAACAPTLGAFMGASLAIGITSSVAQILVPFAANLAPAQTRGRVVGQVMSGLITGILLARAAAGVISGAIGWRAVYGISAGLLVVLVVVLQRTLPARQPTFAQGYAALLQSLVRIYRSEPVLRRRAAYQSAMFGSFSVFWTSITFLLAGPHFHFSQTLIGLFALAGAGSAFFAPVAGRLGDRGHEHSATGIAFFVAIGGFMLTLLQMQLWALVGGAIVIDIAVQTSLILGQRAIYALNPAERSRLNTLYMATFFLGGAIASAAAAAAYARFGWIGDVILGAAMPAAAFLFWLTERPQTAHAPAAADTMNVPGQRAP